MMCLRKRCVIRNKNEWSLKIHASSKYQEIYASFSLFGHRYSFQAQFFFEKIDNILNRINIDFIWV